jgi:Zn ribbon nucleic-acid-binding protein
MRVDRMIEGVDCLECRTNSLVQWKPTDTVCKCLECGKTYGMDWITFVKEGGLE